MTTPRPPVRSTSAEVAEFLRRVVGTPVTPGPRGRLIFALDATASRQPTWDQACQLQGFIKISHYISILCLLTLMGSFAALFPQTNTLP